MASPNFYPEGSENRPSDDMYKIQQKILGRLNDGTPVSLEPGDFEIGAVELKDGSSDTRAKVAVLTTITSSDNGLPVTDPVSVAKLEAVRLLLASPSSLVAGTAIVGKVGIDQTTPGTTNAVSVQSAKGAANLSTPQITTSTTAATLVVARPTRRSVLIRNLDTTITVYVGPATVTSSNGFPIRAGEAIPFSWVGLIQVIAASGTPIVAVADEYD